jgi:N utilization substance protein B
MSMGLTRSELREKVMTILYQKELYDKNKIAYNLDDVIKENLDIDNEFVKDMVYGTVTYIDDIDSIANENLNDWTIDRLDSMGRSILRMSIYELKYMDTPDLVVINEAIELAKKYSDDNVRKMINAVLDKLVNEE